MGKMAAMHIFQALPLLVLLADPEPGWEQAADTDGIKVLVRNRKDSEVREVKAHGMVDAEPERVWKVVRDFPNYPKTMPYIETCQVLGVEQDGKIQYVYTVVNPPIIDRRDFTIRVTDESEWKGGEGYMKSAWTMTSEKGPPLKQGTIRLKSNDGYWKLEPRDGGKKTFVTYYVYTDPGGEVPKWIVNQANGNTVPDVIRAVRKVSTKKE
jgi:hypothetical protein